MSLKEFHDSGLLHEVNRQFLHPLGLALAMSFEPDTNVPIALGPIYETDDPEGYRFKQLDVEKILKVNRRWVQYASVRREVLGYVIQSTTDEGAVEEDKNAQDTPS